MFSLYKQAGETLYGVKEFILDSAADVEKLPKDVRPGSTALVIPTSEIYILNSEKKWILFGSDAE